MSFGWSGRCQARSFPRSVNSRSRRLLQKQQRITKQFQISTCRNSPWFRWSTSEFSSALFASPGNAHGGRQSSASYLSVSSFLANLSCGCVVSPNYPRHISHISYHSSLQLRCASCRGASHRRAPTTLHPHIKGEAPSTEGWLHPQTESERLRREVRVKKK